jgi:hypothetical protein
MTRFDKYNPRANMPKRPWTVHPIWRGIGCFMFFIIPIMAYAGAVLLVQENVRQGWLPMPQELTRTITIPMLGSYPNLLAYLIVAVALTVVGFGVFTAIYSMFYSLVGPSRFGPLDVPPIRPEDRLLDTYRPKPGDKKQKK